MKLQVRERFAWVSRQIEMIQRIAYIYIFNDQFYWSIYEINEKRVEWSNMNKSFIKVFKDSLKKDKHESKRNYQQLQSVYHHEINNWKLILDNDFEL